MERRFYILNHPIRDVVKEQCIFLEKENSVWNKKSGEVIISVDHMNPYSNNQDLYVFHISWLYGYCETALLRNEFIKPVSKYYERKSL